MKNNTSGKILPNPFLAAKQAKPIPETIEAFGLTWRYSKSLGRYAADTRALTQLERNGLCRALRAMNGKTSKIPGTPSSRRR